MGDHWKSLADKLGAPGMDDPTSSEETSASEPQLENAAAPQAEHRPESKVVEPKPAEPAPKSKKKSSWEALASIFNIRTEAPAETVAELPVEPEEEVRNAESFTVAFKSEPKPAPKESRLHVFPESLADSREKPANSALEEMFADAPRGDLDSWKKSPRVVDDLGWDDEPPKSREVDEEIADLREVDSESDLDEAAPVEGEERRPRRRRRRRGPRRPATDVAAEPNLLDSGEDMLSVEPGEEWAEPETFEVGTEEGQDAAEASDPERRSSRRRRRGRKRPTDDSAAPRTDAERGSADRGERPVAADRAERVANRDSEERPNRRPERRTEGERTERERAEPRVRAERGERTERASRGGEAREHGERAERTERVERPERAERPERVERAERPERVERAERPERTERPERQPRVHQERPLPPRADADESDDVDELDDSENSAIKHRNIPTWEDSLQSIIEANMANHNRNDSRGGGGQQSRGRPRGRGR